MVDQKKARKNSSNVSSHNLISEYEVTADFMIQNATYTVEEVVNIVGVGVFQMKLVVLSGFVWMARGFEYVVIRYISAVLTCNWKLKRGETSLMAVVTILSTILGCFVFSSWSDNYGRRMALSSSISLLCVFSAVSAGLPSYTWFLLSRAVSGFATGGLNQTLVLCCEYMPSRKRGRAVYILSCFWTLGVILMLSLLFLTLETSENWRSFIIIGALPAFMAMILMRFYPESVHFLLLNNQYVAANEMVKEITETNKKILSGTLHPAAENKYRRGILDILTTQYIRSTLLFWFMGIATAATFMGLMAMTPQLFAKGKTEPLPYNANAENYTASDSAYIPCLKGMSTKEFGFIVWTNALDFPGFVIYMILVDLIDRKKLLCASYLLSSLFIFFLFIPSSNFVVHVSFAYCARTLLLSQFDLLLLTAAETFPTSHRGCAVGFEAASFYFGQLIGYYMFQTLLKMSFTYSVLMFGLLTSLCSVASMCLKHETRGKELPDIIK